MKRSGIFIFILIAFIVFSFTYGDARVGGGHTYGGGGHRSGSFSHHGGGGDGGELIITIIRILIWLIIEVPEVGIPLTLIIIIVIIVNYAKQGRTYIKPSYVNTYYHTSNLPIKTVSLYEKINRYRKNDPNFSKPLFLDFAQLIYCKIYEANKENDWKSLEPYITPGIMEKLKQGRFGFDKIENIVIGKSSIMDIYMQSGESDQITLEFEANYNEYRKGISTIYYVKEKWSFQRKKGILSKGPEDIVSLQCPSCGSPVELRSDGSCPYCNNVVRSGNFHWQLFNIIPVEKYPRPPLQFGRNIESGTYLPDIIQPDFDAKRRAFQMRYPNFSWPEFYEKVKKTFIKLQEIWSSGNWQDARPFETDNLFSSHRYWIEQYKSQGLRNCLEDIEIISIIPVKIEQDAYYESITVRIKANMKDYTIDQKGNILEGNKNTGRVFSEYWTFIRRAGFAEDKKEKKENTCPNCGAPIKVNMAGICQYCDSKITSGQFDWVLSMIEQDEAYEG